MSYEPGASYEPGEVRRLFAEEARAERPDLATLCFLIGAEADPSLGPGDLDALQVELDRFAGELPYRPGGAREWAEAVRGLLGERYGFRGDASDYQRLDSSLLPQVLERRRGLPILLSVVWIEVARRAGAPVYGIAAPGHFVVGFGSRAERVVADPFDGGRVIEAGPRSPAQEVGAADPLAVVSRILNNIRAWASGQLDRSEAALWAVDLSLLLPSHPAQLRYERGKLLIQRGDYLGGAAELEAYAEIVEPVDESAAEKVRGEALGARSLLN
ncbi:transglutaminase-like domain-containing protein [Streptomyces roseirectus]|uniref:transglutaminase family protein n=1 Tax=Streptomyces roseirectus TaxID=2768066 RepID=UPI001FECBE60|nr:transglutaminase-like domain-containing protein [Streptomyces roseirectus]